MNFIQYFNYFNVNEKKIIYLIYFLPISLIAGSLVTNINILIIGFYFLYDFNKKIK